MSRIAVVGPGAIGSSVAALLDRTGRHEIVVCARTPFLELVVDSPDGPIHATPRIVTRPEDAGACDWVFLATKAHQTESARGWLEALAVDGTPIAVLQNGVEHESRVRPFAGRAPIVPVVVACPAERLAPGRVRLRRKILLTVPAGEVGEAFAALFEASPIEAVVTRDFATVLWSKLCANAAGALTALTGQPNGVFASDDVADLARAIVRETIRVGRAEGAVLDDALAETIVDGLRAARPDGAPSILQDLRARRVLEYDARNGAVVRFGEKHGVPTPLNRMATTLLAAISASFASDSDRS